MKAGLQMIPISFIYLGTTKLPINRKTFELAVKLEKGEINKNNLPPITVHYKCDGRLHLVDGGHRVAALKLIGFEMVFADIKLNLHRENENTHL